MTTDLDHTDATEHAQALFRQLFLASPDAIVVTAVNGRISAVNPAAEQLFGYSEYGADWEPGRNAHPGKVSRSSSPAP